MKSLFFFILLTTLSMTTLASNNGGGHGGGGAHGGGGGGAHGPSGGGAPRGGGRPNNGGGNRAPAQRAPAQRAPAPGQNRGPIQNHGPNNGQNHQQPGQNRGPNNGQRPGGVVNRGGVNHGGVNHGGVNHGGMASGHETHVTIHNSVYVQRGSAHYGEGNWHGRSFLYYHSVYGSVYGWHGGFWGVYRGPWIWGPYNWGWPGYVWWPYWSLWWPVYPTIVYPYQYVAQAVIVDYTQQAYNEGYVAGQASVIPVSPEIRDKFAGEVNNISANINADKSLQLEDALNTEGFLFPLDGHRSILPIGGGAACTLLPGDFLTVVTAPTADQNAVMRIVATKGNCIAGKTIPVSAEDLQTMLNALGGHVDDKLQKLDKDHPTP